MVNGTLKSKGRVDVAFRHYAIAVEGAPRVDTKEAVDAVLDAMGEQHGLELKGLVLRVVRVRPELRDLWHIVEPPELYCRAIEM